eukprot:COSAG02_NODE_63988_length_261_cov_2.530864_1_plen_49_part_10
MAPVLETLHPGEVRRGMPLLAMAMRQRYLNREILQHFEKQPLAVAGAIE